jgi:hypothetical protein
MFKGLHQLMIKPRPAAEPVMKAMQVSVVQSAENLLSAEKRQQHLKAIKSLLNLPPKLYDRLYGKVLNAFAEFVQTLPQTQYGAFSNMGGFLDHGIERAARALSLCLAYFHPEEKSFHDVSPQEALWIYAVFTAALFLDLGKLAVKYQITLCDKNGTSIKQWLPYSGVMVGQGDYYKYDFVKENRDNLGRLVTAILARQILLQATEEDAEDGDATGTGGFEWIASNPDVLEAWLSMLNTEGRPMGSFMTVIPLADAQVIEGYFGIQKPIRDPNAKPFAGTMFDSAAGATATGSEEGSTLAPSVDAGETFFRWLRAGLASGAISINDLASQVQIVREGVLMSSEIFKTFATANPQYRNPEGVEQQFNKLLELYIEPIGKLQQRYSHLKGGVFAQTQQHWLLVNNPHLLFALGQLPSINANLVKLPAAQHTVVTPPPQRPKSGMQEQPAPRH